MAINVSKTANMKNPGGGGEGQSYGVGNTDASFREATRKGKYPVDNTGPDRSQGETPGAGSIYTAMLNERPNLSNLRNLGPERAPSRVGGTALPIATMDTRATGRLSGSD